MYFPPLNVIGYNAISWSVLKIDQNGFCLGFASPARGLNFARK